MKKLTIPCNFGNQRSPVDFYVGSPKADNHPIQNQSHWLSSDRGGVVPSEIMDSLQRLHDLSKKNKVPFEELCMYAIESANPFPNLDSKDDNEKIEENKVDEESLVESKEEQIATNDVSNAVTEQVNNNISGESKADDINDKKQEQILEESKEVNIVEDKGDIQQKEDIPAAEQTESAGSKT